MLAIPLKICVDASSSYCPEFAAVSFTPVCALQAQAVRRTRQKGKKHTVLVSPAHSDHYLVDVLRQFHEVDLVSVAFDYDTKSQVRLVLLCNRPQYLQRACHVSTY